MLRYRPRLVHLHTYLMLRYRSLLLHLHTYLMLRYRSRLLHLHTYLMLRYRPRLVHLHTYLMLRYRPRLLHLHTWCYATDGLGWGGWGGLITFNGTHTWCYATGLFSCTCTHSWCYATDLISCTCTHSWCYATRLFSCTSTHSCARKKTKSPILSFPQVRRPGFQFGGGLHQRKRGIAKPSQGKTFLAGKKPCAETREDGRMPTNPCPPAKKDRPRQPWRTKAIRNMQNIRDG